jgi:hypothetical protein
LRSLKGRVLKENYREALYWFATEVGMPAVAMSGGAPALQNPGLVLRMSFR